MRPFAALERFFERVFERPSARLFHARLQPIQLQRRVERAMETGRLSTADRVVVPNRYMVHLAPADLTAFGDLANSLELELSEAALRFARAHHYSVSDRPAVRLVPDAAIAAGDAHVDASFSDGIVPMPPAAPAAPAAPSAPPEPVVPERPVAPPPNPAVSDPPAAVPAVEQSSPPDAQASIRSAGRPRDAAAAPIPAPPLWQPTAEPVAPAAPPPMAPPPAPPPTLAPIDLTRTMTFEVPTVDSPLAILREFAPDGSQRQLTLDGAPVTIGRATDNFLVLRDARVSRYHGRLQARSGALVYSDLGSTNGSRVNGIEIDEVVLGVGDRIEVGDTVLVVESASGA